MSNLPNTHYRARALSADAAKGIAALEHFNKLRRVAIEIDAKLTEKKNDATLIAEKNAALAALRSKALTAPEIGRLGDFDRVKAQRSAFLFHLMSFYRDNPEANCEPGVIALATFYSDNDDGICTLSESTMAAMLARTRERVSKAARKAADRGRILKLNEPRKSSILAPVIPQALAAPHNITWLLKLIEPWDDLITTSCDAPVTSKVQTCDAPVTKHVTLPSLNM